MFTLILKFLKQKTIFCYFIFGFNIPLISFSIKWTIVPILINIDLIIYMKKSIIFILFYLL